MNFKTKTRTRVYITRAQGEKKLRRTSWKTCLNPKKGRGGGDEGVLEVCENSGPEQRNMVRYTQRRYGAQREMEKKRDCH